MYQPLSAAPARNIKQSFRPKYSLEFWADSFHEGTWACESLKEHLKFESVEFLQGFIPQYRFRIGDGELLEITVLGSYKSWTPIPEKIEDLLDWGKPDLVIYDPLRKVIVAAAEETAAVPTGNQALQRCERIYGSARSRIPFWYLLPEYGLHIDQGERRDSIWPTIFALKLTLYYGIPSVVLHYAEHGKPEAYDAGTGLRRLFQSLAFQLEIYLGLHKPSDFLPSLTEQYGTMLAFIRSQWQEMTRFLPGEELLGQRHTAELLAARAIGGETPKALVSFLVWKAVADVPGDVRKTIKPQTLIKPDPFLSVVEQQVGRNCYTLSGNSGSRPQPPSKIAECIDQQRRMAKFDSLAPPAIFSMKLADFPESKAGGRHLTTAKNVVYLFDSWGALFSSLVQAYPRLKALGNKIPTKHPALLYVSNSIKPGRIFGDPFTGQLAAYSFVFGKDASAPRAVLAYYPHQVHTQLFNNAGAFNKNKGITLLREVADYAIFHGGVAVNMKTGEIF